MHISQQEVIPTLLITGGARVLQPTYDSQLVAVSLSRPLLGSRGYPQDAGRFDSATMRLNSLQNVKQKSRGFFGPGLVQRGTISDNALPALVISVLFMADFGRPKKNEDLVK